MNKMNFSLISRNRNTIYGISMLWIMLFHSSFEFTVYPLAKLKSLGNCGPDIFLFVSGISLYFSLVKGISLQEFYRRRLRRVVVPAMITSVPWFGFLALHKKSSFSAFLLNVTGISLFTAKNKTIWFVTAILICYAIYPLLFRIFKKAGHSVLALLAMLAVSFTINMTLHSLFPLFWENSEILFRRIPVFILGSYAGRFVYEKHESIFTVSQAVCLAAGIVAIYLLTEQYWCSYISSRYSYIILAVCFTVIFAVMGNVPFISRIAAWLAPISLETYLCHEKVLRIITAAAPSLGIAAINVIAGFIAVLLARALLKIEKSCSQKMSVKGC